MAVPFCYISNLKKVRTEGAFKTTASTVVPAVCQNRVDRRCSGLLQVLALCPTVVSSSFGEVHLQLLNGIDAKEGTLHHLMSLKNTDLKVAQVPKEIEHIYLTLI